MRRTLALFAVCFAATSHADILQPRDLDGNASTIEAYYDPSSNLTWLADANYARTTGVTADGSMTWSQANAWAGALTVGTVSGWRLPTVTDFGADGCNSSGGGTDCGYNVAGSELGHLIYTTLGNLAFCAVGDNACAAVPASPQPGWAGVANSGPFSNIASIQYWTGTAYAPSDTVNAWFFYPYFGSQNATGQQALFAAWAVKDGDVTAVPLPASAWLLLSGLVGMLLLKASTATALRTTMPSGG